MAKKTKPSKKIKLGPRVSIGNSAVSSVDILNQALNFKSKSSPTKRYKFLSVAMGVYSGAVVLSWAVKNLGFGEVTFYLQNGKVNLDSEGMSGKFVQALVKEVLKQEKNGTLKLEVNAPVDKVLARILENVTLSE